MDLNRHFPKQTYKWLTGTHKVLTITNNEGNTNQNSDIASHLSEWLLSKSNSKSWQEYREKGIVIHCSWECKLVQPIWKRVWGFFR